jgi:hypothetical protein
MRKATIAGGFLNIWRFGGRASSGHTKTYDSHEKRHFGNFDCPDFKTDRPTELRRARCLRRMRSLSLWTLLG